MPPKRGTRPRVYSTDTINKAVEMVKAKGLAETAREMGIPKATVHVWSKQANVSTATAKLHEQTEAATEASRVRRRHMVEQANERMTVALAAIAEMGAKAELDILQAVTRSGTFPVGVGRGKSARVTLNEIVGCRTRAIHDLQLLTGKATERNDAPASTEAVVALQRDLRQRLGA